jgi:hypothetical protein
MLTAKQKFTLVKLIEAVRERRAPEVDPDVFRHDFVARATGKLGLRCCGQEDYPVVYAAALAELGHEKRARAILARASENDRRVAMFILKRDSEERGLGIQYADAIARRQFRCGLADCSVSQLWCLIFTVRSRRKPFFTASGASQIARHNAVAIQANS